MSGQSSMAEDYFPGIIHYHDEEQVIGSKGGRLFRRKVGDSWEPLCRLPVAWSERIRASSRLWRRCFRAQVWHAMPVGDGEYLIAAHGRFFLFDSKNNRFADAVVPIQGSRPLSLCKAAASEIYYGEYCRNLDRKSVHVFRSEDGGRTWASAYEFTGVRHVHGVFQDPYTNDLWVTTGDDDQESGIWRTSDRFRTLTPFLMGGQQRRAVDLLFTADYVYFGSDTPREKNHLYRACRVSREVESLQEVDESVFFGAKVGGRCFFSTACEPSSVNRTSASTVWGTVDGKAWSRVAEFQKDRWSARFFQYGQVRFPAGPGDGVSLWITPFATEGDQSSWQIPVASIL